MSESAGSLGLCQRAADRDVGTADPARGVARFQRVRAPAVEAIALSTAPRKSVISQEVALRDRCDRMAADLPGGCGGYQQDAYQNRADQRRARDSGAGCAIARRPTSGCGSRADDPGAREWPVGVCRRATGGTRAADRLQVGRPIQPQATAGSRRCTSKRASPAFFPRSSPHTW